jgi:predicted RecB family nuclease
MNRQNSDKNEQSMKPKIRLSKSQYCKGKNCLKAVWLYNFRKDLKDDSSEFQEILFKQGNEVGKLAHQRFPGGELIDEDYRNAEGALKHTQEALNRGAKCLYEAAFCWKDILIRVDVIVKHDDGSFDLVEVKSTNSVKEEHLHDVAIQKYVLEKLGHTVHGCYLMHLNRDYLRDGNLSVDDLFVLQKLGSELEPAYQAIGDNLKKIRATLKKTKEPEVPIGSRCSTPYDCEFTNYCWSGVDDLSIHRLPRISDKQREQLVNRGITNIKEIPDEFELTANQQTQVIAAKESNAIINLVAIANHLKGLRYPLYFFDFESASFALPPYDKTHPYLHLPFQYSLHVQMNEKLPLEYIEFLYDADSDPRRAIAESLCKNLGEKGSIIVYHASYEKQRLEHLAAIFPDLAPKLQKIISRLWDLETPFSKRWYCDWKFAGSSSIKNVLPVMVTDLSYEDLEIKDGSSAQVRYEDMIKKGPNHQTARQALLEYCKRDTMAMVRILEELLKICPVKIG